MPAPANHHLQEDAATDDSDADSDAYYHPISAYDGSDSDDVGGEVESTSPLRPNGAGADLFHRRDPNPNPDSLHLHAENGISALDLNGFDGDRRGMDEDEDEDEEEEEDEEERTRESSISTAFREDENRRSAPLTPEAAVRIMDAMRGVSFRGLPPAWADQLPEDRWLDQLRRLRGETAPQS